MNICKDCGHPALNHFVLGTKCNIDGCDCWNSQRQIIMDDGSARIAELETEVAGYRADQVIAVEAIRAQAAEIKTLKQALELIFEVHPTRNTKENYAAAVCEIADNALKAGQQ